ncbi:L,D-transpeptidase family protein [Neorhodopirellula pilleata]|uniref:LysM domain protein n=1 Tax=Neorhodopirellula pilleata TaxID=2714738 RepID=A0A5C6AYB6_9BACT|nr:L,D-transpeptidase family protein [Neorhodopirellula pilleata]TWU04102.1 LysM domain protein [Neorhodopirellula pilleata]
MQTLKTAAIVVLLMTVLYGAYVSMTTPPDPLPQGVESMLVESGLDDFPDNFDDFGIDSGTLEELAPPKTVASNSNGMNPKVSGNNAMSFGAVDQTFADVGSDDGSAASFQLSDLDAPQNSPNRDAQAARLPDVGMTAGSSIRPDPNQDYPSTGSNFSLPDPTDAMQADVPAKTSREADLAAAGLANAIATADRQYTSDRRREALATLSLFYETPNLTSDQREELLIRLDPLAREVIYSPEHLLEQPHRVSGSETLMDIAQKYDVPWQLLANINGIDDPVTVLPGTDLKVLRGPFRADVDLGNQELTLFLGDLYAGRFPIGVGTDPVPRAGTYTIQEKNSAKTYYDLSGNPVPPGNPRNPYGAMWIDLGSGISLHGSPQADKPTDQGCISIAGNYSRDVFGILSEGSSVTIR